MTLALQILHKKNFIFCWFKYIQIFIFWWEEFKFIRLHYWQLCWNIKYIRLLK